MEIQILNAQNFRTYKFLCGDIFWVKNSGKKILISSIGEFSNFDFIEKLLVKNEVIEFHPKIDSKLIEKIADIFENFKNAQFETERVEVRERFLNVLIDNPSQSQLAFSCALFSQLYELSRDVEEIYLSKNIFLLSRLVSIASCLVIQAIIDGYLEYTFLKNLYNTVLLSDVFLADQNVDLNNLNVFTLEFNEHGKKAIKYLKDKNISILLDKLLSEHEGAQAQNERDILQFRKKIEYIFNINTNNYSGILVRECFSNIEFKEAS